MRTLLESSAEPGEVFGESHEGCYYKMHPTRTFGRRTPLHMDVSTTCIPGILSGHPGGYRWRKPVQSPNESLLENTN